MLLDLLSSSRSAAAAAALTGVHPCKDELLTELACSRRSAEALSLSRDMSSSDHAMSPCAPGAEEAAHPVSGHGQGTGFEPPRALLDLLSSSRAAAPAAPPTGPRPCQDMRRVELPLVRGSYGAGEGMPERAPKKAPPQALQQQPAAAGERTPRQGGSAGEPAAAARAVMKRLLESPAAQQARPTKTRRGEPGVLVSLVRGSSGEGEGGIHTDVSIMQFNINKY